MEPGALRGMLRWAAGRRADGGGLESRHGASVAPSLGSSAASGMSCSARNRCHRPLSLSSDQARPILRCNFRIRSWRLVAGLSIILHSIAVLTFQSHSTNSSATSNTSNAHLGLSIPPRNVQGAWVVRDGIRVVTEEASDTVLSDRVAVTIRVNVRGPATWNEIEDDSSPDLKSRPTEGAFVPPWKILDACTQQVEEKLELLRKLSNDSAIDEANFEESAGIENEKDDFNTILIRHADFPCSVLFKSGNYHAESYVTFEAGNFPSAVLAISLLTKASGYGEEISEDDCISEEDCTDWERENVEHQPRDAGPQVLTEIDSVRFLLSNELKRAKHTELMKNALGKAESIYRRNRESCENSMRTGEKCLGSLRAVHVRPLESIPRGLPGGWQWTFSDESDFDIIARYLLDAGATKVRLRVEIVLEYGPPAITPPNPILHISLVGAPSAQRDFFQLFKKWNCAHIDVSIDTENQMLKRALSMHNETLFDVLSGLRNVANSYKLRSSRSSVDRHSPSKIFRGLSPIWGGMRSRKTSRSDDLNVNASDQKCEDKESAHFRWEHYLEGIELRERKSDNVCDSAHAWKDQSRYGVRSRIHVDLKFDNDSTLGTYHWSMGYKSVAEAIYECCPPPENEQSILTEIRFPTVGSSCQDVPALSSSMFKEATSLAMELRRSLHWHRVERQFRDGDKHKTKPTSNDAVGSQRLQLAGFKFLPLGNKTILDGGTDSTAPEGHREREFEMEVVFQEYNNPFSVAFENCFGGVVYESATAIAEKVHKLTGSLWRFTAALPDTLLGLVGLQNLPNRTRTSTLMSLCYHEGGRFFDHSKRGAKSATEKLGRALKGSITQIPTASLLKNRGVAWQHCQGAWETLSIQCSRAVNSSKDGTSKMIAVILPKAGKTSAAILGAVQKAVRKVGGKKLETQCDIVCNMTKKYIIVALHQARRKAGLAHTVWRNSRSKVGKSVSIALCTGKHLLKAGLLTSKLTWSALRSMRRLLGFGFKTVSFCGWLVKALWKRTGDAGKLKKDLDFVLWLLGFH